MLTTSKYPPFTTLSFATGCFYNCKSGYSFRFNGMENDKETYGGGNALDFGARIYDGRICRFLSVDCRFQSLPSLSCYSNSANSPIFLKDVNGEYPKVAIIITNGDERGFEEHKIALEKQGYLVVSAKTGEEALKCMNQYSTPESPTTFLVLLSHGSPGGISSNVGGIWTESELEIYTKNEWESNAFEQFTKMNGIITDYASPDFDRDKYDEAMKGYESWKSEEFEKIKAQLIQEFKEKYGVVTTTDISNEIKNGNFETKKSYYSIRWMQYRRI